METKDRDSNELVELARKIHAWQNQQGVTNSQMIRDYPGLGSDKTYSRLRDGHTEEYDVEGQLVNYRAVWAVIEITSGAAGTEEQLFDDLTAVLQVKRAALETMKASERGLIDRVVLVEGSSGIGKSAAFKILVGRYGQRVALVEAMDVWQDNPSALLAEIIKALNGKESVPVGRVARMEKAIELLSLSKKMLIVDEVHHLGPHSLNAIKTLTNKTPGEFMLGAIPTLWARMETNAYQEARQLTTNRLSERIKLVLTEADIARYLGHRLAGASPDMLKVGSRLIRPMATECGNMLFVRIVAESLLRLDAIDERAISAAVQNAAKRRGKQQG